MSFIWLHRKVKRFSFLLSREIYKVCGNETCCLPRGRIDEGEQQQPQTEDVPNVEAPRRSQRVRKSAIPADYEVYNTEEFQMEDDPTSFEEAMRSDHSSKWLEAIEDEMKSMNANRVWDLEIIPKRANTVGCKWVYRIKLDSQGNIETYKA